MDSLERSLEIIKECNERWSWLVTGRTANTKNHYIAAKYAASTAPTPLLAASAFATAYAAPVAAPPLSSVSSSSSSSSSYYNTPFYGASPLPPAQSMYQSYASSSPTADYATTPQAATTNYAAFTNPYALPANGYSSPSSSSSSSSLYPLPSSSSSSSSSLAAVAAGAASSDASFASCTERCRSLSAEVTQTCVASCVDKYGRRSLLIAPQKPHTMMRGSR